MSESSSKASPPEGHETEPSSEENEGASSSEESESKTKNPLWTIASQSSFVFVGSILGMGAGFVSNYLMASGFGPETIGRYSLVTTILSFLTILTLFGFNQGLLKYIPRFAEDESESARLHQVMADAFMFVLLFTGAASALLVLGRDVIARRIFDDPGLSAPLLIAGGVLFPLTCLKLMKGVYDGFKHSAEHKYMGSLLTRVLLLSGIGLLMLMGWKGISWVVGVYFAAQLLASLALFYRACSFNFELSGVVESFQLFVSSPNRSELRWSLLKFSGTMILLSIIGILLGRIDVLMLGYFLESSDVGIYRIALLVSGMPRFFLSSINAIFSPFISELFGEDAHEELERLYSTTTKWIITATLPVVMSMCLYPDTILHFFGSEYQAGAWALIILAFGNLVNNSVGSNGHILKLGGHEQLVLLNNSAMAVGNVLMNILLIPWIGIVGAAVATGVSNTVVSLVKVAEVKYLLDIFPYDSTFAYIPLLVVCLGAFGWLARPYVHNVWAVVGVTLFNLLLTLGIWALFMDERDRRLLETARDKVGL